MQLFSYIFGTLCLCLHHTDKQSISAKNYVIFALQSEGIYWYHTLSHDVETPSGKVLKDFLLIFVAETKYFKKWVLNKIN